MNLFYLLSDSSISQLIQTWLVIMTITSLACFIVGELTKNFSQVDKIWSIMPIVYSWVTLLTFPHSERLWIMTILVSIWGLRLSYNFYRKGGYNKIPWKGEEDYRWEVLRQNPILKKGNRITLFNFFFISLYQHILILLFSTPLLIAAKYASISLSGLDFVAALFMFIFIIIETLADNQLFEFHQQKQLKIPQTVKFQNSLTKGFMVDGFWKYARHPNFAAEQAIWISFYFFGVAASAILFNITLTGFVLLILLFAGSTGFTESISLGKYPAYLSYKQNVPKFIPIHFRYKKNKFSRILFNK